MSYEKNKFNLQTYFKEHIMSVSWGSPVFIIIIIKGKVIPNIIF
jgi:hypothetical protein